MSDEFDPRLQTELHTMSDEATSGMIPPSAARARARGDRIRTRRRVAAAGVVAALLVAGVGTAAAVLPTTMGQPQVAATPSTAPSVPSSPTPSSPSVGIGEDRLPTADQIGRYAASDWEVDPDPEAVEVDCLSRIIAPTDPQATVERSYRLASSGTARARAVSVQYADEAAAEAAWAEMESFLRVCREAHAAVPERTIGTVQGPFTVTTAEQARYGYLPYETAGDPSSGTWHLLGMVRSGARIGLVEMSLEATELTVSDDPADVDTTGVPLNPMWPTLEAYEQQLG